MRRYRAKRPLYISLLSQKNSTGGRNKPKSQFFQMCLLPGKHPAVCLFSLSACQMRFWPSGQSHSATYRQICRIASTSGRHVPHIVSLLPPSPHPCFHFPPSPPFFFFASANYKHMRPCGSTDCCQTSRLLFLLSSALWHAGRFMLPPKKSLNGAFSFVGRVLRRQLSLEGLTVRSEQEGEMWRGCAFFLRLSCLIWHPDTMVPTERKALSLA